MPESYDDMAVEVLEELLPDWVDAYQQGIEQEGYKLTQELMRDFRYKIVRSTGIVSAEIEFRKYGRYKDMRQLRFRRLPDLDAIVDFVMKAGVENFAFVPGYQSAMRAPTVSKAVQRVAAGVAFGFLQRGNVKRDGKGWYNTTTMKQLNNAKGALRRGVNRWFARELKKSAEDGQ
ncbi:MAG: hypothetical protein EAZ63_03810 [Runella slithyformis]|nr:MAG: hypothetical protein EAZ63_03810 [Runella slithyformis]